MSFSFVNKIVLQLEKISWAKYNYNIKINKLYKYSIL